MSNERQRLQERYRAAFSTPVGEAVLTDLRREFYDIPTLANRESQHLTTVRAAQRDVVQYILDIVEGRDE